MNQRKPVMITSLSVRFYLSNGWSREALQPYVVKGGLSLRGFGPNESEDQYLIPAVYTRMDMRRMLEDGLIGEIRGSENYTELRGLTALEMLETRNW